MIDEDKSDYIDLSEFSKVQEAVTRQRDHAVSQVEVVDYCHLRYYL